MLADGWSLKEGLSNIKLNMNSEADFDLACDELKLHTDMTFTVGLPLNVKCLPVFNVAVSKGEANDI